MLVAPHVPTSSLQLALPHARNELFLPQFHSDRLPDGLPWGPDNGNCGPTSVVNALRLIGLDVPGFAGERTQDVIDAARLLATGRVDSAAPTFKHEQRLALERAGANVGITHDVSAALAAVRDGAVALIGGDRAVAGWPRRGDDGVLRGPAFHAAVIAGYEVATGRYVVFDPALPDPVSVRADDIALFTESLDGASMPRPVLLVSR